MPEKTRYPDHDVMTNTTVYYAATTVQGAPCPYKNRAYAIRPYEHTTNNVS